MRTVRFVPVSAFLLAGMVACGGTAAPASSPVASPATGSTSASAKPASAAVPAGSAGASAAAGATASLTLQQVIDNAKKETAFKGSWSSDSFGGPDTFNAMVAAVNKKYSLNVKGTFTPGIDMQSMQGKIAQEAAANQPPDSDIYLGNSQAMRDSLDTKTMLPYNWKALTENGLPADGKTFDPYAPDNTGIAIVSAITGVTYNSKLVKQDLIPHKMQDLLNPGLKGKIASTPYAAGFRDFATKDMLGKQPVVDFVTKFSSQVAGLIRCGSNDQISSGEFWMLAFDCGGTALANLQAQGAPLDQVVLDDITSVHSFYAAVPRNSLAPNFAVLMSLYIDSPDGQATMWKNWGGDLYTLPSAHTKTQIDKVRAAAGKFAVDSPQWLSENPDFPQTQQELQKILAKK